MDKKLRQLDLEFIKDHITVKTYPVPGMDVYEMRIYYKGAYLESVEVDGIELESWRYKDCPDPDSYTYEELKEKYPDIWENMQAQKQKEKDDDEEGFRKLEKLENEIVAICDEIIEGCDEAIRKDGWD